MARRVGLTCLACAMLVRRTSRSSLFVVLGTPFIAASQFMVMLDRVMHTKFFDYHQGGGYVLGYQHIFWFYSSPGRLHHDAARVWDRLRGDLRHVEETDLRLPGLMAPS